MALNFIKKVFSFGRNKEEAPAPEPAEETSARPAGEEPVTDDAAATGRAFPTRRRDAVHTGSSGWKRRRIPGTGG